MNISTSHWPILIGGFILLLIVFLFVVAMLNKGRKRI
jgi:uncharacterized integral membrane protein